MPFMGILCNYLPLLEKRRGCFYELRIQIYTEVKQFAKR